MEQFRDAQHVKLLPPDIKFTGPLLGKNNLPVTHPHGGQQAIIAPVQEGSARPPLGIAGQVGKKIIAIEVVAIILAVDLRAGFQLLGNIRAPRSSHKCRHPIGMGHDVIENGPRGYFARPAHHGRHPETALPVGVLLTAERRDTGIRPGIEVRTVVG